MFWGIEAGYATAVAEPFPVALAPTKLPTGVRVGEYYRTARDLYRIEEIHGEFALIEDCRTEIVLEVAISEILHEMQPVRPSAS